MGGDGTYPPGSSSVHETFVHEPSVSSSKKIHCVAVTLINSARGFERSLPECCCVPRHLPSMGGNDLQICKTRITDGYASAQRIFHPNRVGGRVTQRGVIKDHPDLFVQRHVLQQLKLLRK
jgi:hypothetical protein